MTPIVFLHIPKTAGQTIHNELVRLVGGPARVSPVRVHTQAPAGGQMPPGYSLYSGHIDWTELDSLPAPRFTFTTLRDPRERIASFYFYLRDQAAALDAARLEAAENLGMKVIAQSSADDYFFGGTDAWQRFIGDHYDNFYCAYFATRRIRGRSRLRELGQEEVMRLALAGLDEIDAVYHTTALHRLEEEVERRFGTRISVAGNYFNAGQSHGGQAERRWPKLVALMESDASIARLERFAEADEALMARHFAGSFPAPASACRRAAPAATDGAG